MAKSLNDILKRFEDVISGKLPPSKIEPLTTGENPGVDYADKMKGGRDFVGMHTVEKHPDRNGNGDDVFKGSTTKAKMERHGHEPKPKDIKVYNKTQQQNEEADNDDGWYAHKEMHGSKAVSKEEWKKGIRLNKDGKKVQTKKLKEAKDSREYDYEGEMAVTKLKTIVRAAEHLIKMMEPNTNLPEWVQSKIIKAEDYITTAHDYLMSEMNEEVEVLDELTGYRKKKLFGKDPLTAVANRAINRMKLPPNDGGKLSPKVRASNEKNRKVSQMAFDRMEEEVEELDEGIDKAQVERKLRSKYMGGNPKVTFHRGVVKVNAAGKDYHHKITKGQVEARPFMTVDEEYISEAKSKKPSPSTDTPDMAKIRKIAGPGRIMHKEPWHPDHVGHKLYTHTDHNSNIPKIRAFKVHQKTGKVTEFKNYKPSFGEEVELDEGGSQYRSTAGSGKNTNPNLSRLARKLAFEKPKSYRPPGEKSKAENRAILDAEVAKFMKKGGKIRKEEVEELDEAKCNMSEAGTMCEVHGMKACSKEETKPSDKQPMYNGKDKNKKGRQLILDKDLKEMATSQNQAIAARIALKHKREGTMPPKGTASHSMMGMSEKQLHDYTKAEKGAPKKVEESVSDQRSARSTASEKAREKISNALERKKLEKMKHKLKTEQSAPAETVIRMPSGDVGDTGRV